MRKLLVLLVLRARGPDAAPGTLDDAAIEALAVSYKDFAKMDVTPHKTAQHLDNPMVNVYANAAAAPSYRTIVPGGKAPPDFAFAAGSVLVKEMLDPAGGPPAVFLYSLSSLESGAPRRASRRRRRW